MQHVPSCVDYMRGLRDPAVFRFCAIPQIMAAGTLALCYNNGAVFEGVVKMRRGLTARVFGSCSTMAEVYAWFLTFFRELQRKAEHEVAGHDPSLPAMRDAVAKAIELCEKGAAKVCDMLCALRCAEWRRRLLGFMLLAYTTTPPPQPKQTARAAAHGQQQRACVRPAAAARRRHVFPRRLGLWRRRRRRCAAGRRAACRLRGRRKGARRRAAARDVCALCARARLRF